MRKFPLALALLMPHSVAFAHDPVRDPICGMMIDPEHAAASADYLGKTYYFCQIEERAQFLADPAKFVSAKRLQRWAAGGQLIVTIDPGTPAAGSEVRLRVVLAPKKGDGADESAPVELRDPLVYFFEVDRERPARRTTVRLQPLGGNAYGALRLAAHPGDTRFIMEATTSTGEAVRLSGSFTTGESTAPAIADEPFTMARQHEVMRRFGRHWQAIQLELEKENPDAAVIRASASRIEDERKRLPLFELHVNGDDKPEFVKYGEDLKGRLSELGELAARKNFAAARAMQSALETESCVKCHLKFRWDVVRDLSRFPRVEGRK
ncbi:MAG: copper-translocating P-type [Planctomycetota bacterium]|nr:MAG: copper-translocating P-type [Planctomycetota bacterium]